MEFFRLEATFKHSWMLYSPDIHFTIYYDAATVSPLTTELAVFECKGRSLEKNYTNTQKFESKVDCRIHNISREQNNSFALNGICTNYHEYKKSNYS